MGAYLNPGREAFEEALRSQIYVDKTEMIRYLNTIVCTERRYVCVTRPRRFGKTMAGDVVCAYYGRDADSGCLFERCALSKGDASEEGLSWDVYLGAFDIIKLVMTDFITMNQRVEDALTIMKCRVLDELSEAYPDIKANAENDFFESLERFYRAFNTQFVIVIDEWDAIFRERAEEIDGQETHLGFLRTWMQDRPSVALVYMTGILPIKKQGGRSELPMFTEHSMTEPMQLAPYVGFTAGEVEDLCREKGLNPAGFFSRYGGYQLSDKVAEEATHHAYEALCPHSVVCSMLFRQLHDYWNETESIEALRPYINLGFEGLKQDVVALMEGGRVAVDISTSPNDMLTFHSKDDVLTLLIHLGYLGYDSDASEVFIPNEEVLDAFRTATKDREWAETFRARQR